MSHTLVKKTAIVTVSIWAVVLLSVIAVSMLNVNVGGVAPEAFRLMLMMTLPFTVGLSVVAVGTAFLIQVLVRIRQSNINSAD